MPARVPFCCSLIRPASSTVWPVATEIELLTLRSDTVGVRLSPRCRRRHVADFLLDVEPDVAVDADARRHPQDDAGVAIVDGIDDGVARRQHGGAAGGYRHDVADLQRGRLVVDDDERRIGQHLDGRDRVQRVENDARLCFGADQEVEAGKCAIDEALETDPATEASPGRGIGGGRRALSSPGCRGSSRCSASVRDSGWSDRI